MIGNAYSHGPHPRRSFLSSLVLGFSAIGVSLIAAGSAITLYGMNIVDRKTGNVFEFVEEAIRGLPELAESLPPVLADVLNDERRPDYAEHLDVSARLTTSRRGTIRPVVEVRNHGSEVVSLLSLRVVVIDEDGNPVAERNEWGATPFAAEHDWRGPLMPGSVRRFAAGRMGFSKELHNGNLRVEIDVTDVRVWSGHQAKKTALAHSTSNDS